MIEIPEVFSPAGRQRVFRRLLAAAARPGTVVEVASLVDGAPAWVAVLSVFLDRAATFADPDGLLSESERAFLPARSAVAERAGWLVRDGRLPVEAGFAPELGSLEEPQRGATLVLCVEALGCGRTLLLRGAGIDGIRAVAVTGLDPSWLAARAAWCTFFPRGIDLVLADRQRITVLPRSTRVEPS